ncbi:MAG TPA: hypothetical protein DEH78_30545 [Solibacterales bacterium]|nr:hypothetical protein [Bryobacterales bacterium]
MSKRLETLSKDLAAGMSRRSAFKRFLGGLGAGVALAMSGRRASASDMSVCVELCRVYDGRLFGECVSESAQCPDGYCARALQVNGSTPNAAITWVCMPTGPIAVPA